MVVSFARHHTGLCAGHPLTIVSPHGQPNAFVCIRVITAVCTTNPKRAAVMAGCLRIVVSCWPSGKRPRATRVCAFLHGLLIGASSQWAVRLAVLAAISRPHFLHTFLLRAMQLVMKIFKAHQAKAKSRVDQAAKTKEAEKPKPKVVKQAATITPKSPPK